MNTDYLSVHMRYSAMKDQPNLVKPDFSSEDTSKSRQQIMIMERIANALEDIAKVLKQ